MLKTCDLFDLTHTLAHEYLSRTDAPWLLLPILKTTIPLLGRALGRDYRRIDDAVWIHKTASVAPSAHIGAPCIIGPGTQVRHCAFIRESALIGENCVVGNSTELKNVILFDEVQVPHYNYVGDSILGYRAHMGAGSITSNVKSDKRTVFIRDGQKKEFTGMKKLGALIGDCAEIGCNAVLNPGAVIGRNSIIYPLCSVRGTVTPDSIMKGAGVTVRRDERREEYL